MNKKKLAIFGVLMLLLCTVSCGNSTSTDEATENSANAGISEEDNDKSVEDNVASDNVVDQEDEKKVESDIDDSREVTLEETTIYDENGIKAVLTGISDWDYGKNVEITISNECEKNISWAVEYIVINDVTIPCAVTNSVPSGKIGNAKYPIEEEYLLRYGITDINTIQLNCSITDEETYERIDSCTSERVTTSLGSDYVLSLPIDNWELVKDSDSFKVYYTGLKEYNLYGSNESRVVFMFFNDSESTIIIAPEDISFDGVMDYNNGYAFTVGPKSYGEFYLVSGEDVAEKEEATFSIRAMYGEDSEWDYIMDATSVNLK